MAEPTSDNTLHQLQSHWDSLSCRQNLKVPPPESQTASQPWRLWTLGGLAVACAAAGLFLPLHPTDQATSETTQFSPQPLELKLTHALSLTAAAPLSFSKALPPEQLTDCDSLQFASTTPSIRIAGAPRRTAPDREGLSFGPDKPFTLSFSN